MLTESIWLSFQNNLWYCWVNTCYCSSINITVPFFDIYLLDEDALMHWLLKVFKMHMFGGAPTLIENDALLAFWLVVVLWSPVWDSLVLVIKIHIWYLMKRYVETYYVNFLYSFMLGHVQICKPTWLGSWVKYVIPLGWIIDVSINPWW